MYQCSFVSYIMYIFVDLVHNVTTAMKNKKSSISGLIMLDMIYLCLLLFIASENTTRTRPGEIFYPSKEAPLAEGNLQTKTQVILQSQNTDTIWRGADRMHSPVRHDYHTFLAREMVLFL